MACLEETLAHYMAAAVTYARGINDAFLRRMAADHADICAFFERFCPKEKARACRRRAPVLAASPHPQGTWEGVLAGHACMRSLDQGALCWRHMV